MAAQIRAADVSLSHMSVNSHVVGIEADVENHANKCQQYVYLLYWLDHPELDGSTPKDVLRTCCLVIG